MITTSLRRYIRHQECSRPSILTLKYNWSVEFTFGRHITLSCWQQECHSNRELEARTTTANVYSKSRMKWHCIKIAWGLVTAIDPMTRICGIQKSRKVVIRKCEESDIDLDTELCVIIVDFHESCKELQILGPRVDQFQVYWTQILISSLTYVHSTVADKQKRCFLEQLRFGKTRNLTLFWKSHF